MSLFIRRSFRPGVERLESRDVPSNVVFVREATGANVLAIAGALGAFRADLGALNANVAGSLGSGRREINWDGVPDTVADPAKLPGDFFNSTSPRGVTLSSPGDSGFLISADPGNPTNTPVRFGDLNAGYPTAFATLSAERLFAPAGGTVTDVTFTVPGSTAPAGVRGFGAVFADVDTVGAAKLEFFDAAGRLLLSRSVQPTAGDGGLSFLGVTFDAPDVARVRITTGTAPLGVADVTQGGTADVVALDDFVFGEPAALPAGGFVSGTVFRDANQNGTFDAGEGGLAGATVFADLNANGASDAGEPSATTATNGGYTFAVAAAGPATVRVVLPTGFAATTATATAVAVQSGATSVVNFGGRSTALTGIPVYAVAAGGASGRQVVVFDPTGSARFNLSPFPGFAGGVRVATGDVTGDGQDDVIVAAGPGGGPHVKVYDGVGGGLVREFFAYPSAFGGGVFVAAADLTGDGKAEIITGAGPGPGPQVRVFDGATGARLADFAAFDGFQGGVTVAGGDTNGDGRADVTVGAGPGGGPHVKVFDGKALAQGGPAAAAAIANPLRSFFAFPASFGGGVYVAAGDFDGDTRADVVVGAGPGGGPHVRVLSGFDGAELASFFAFGRFTGGVRVAARDLTGDGRVDLILAAGPGGGSHVRVLNAATMADLRSFFGFDAAFVGGVYVG